MIRKLVKMVRARTIRRTVHKAALAPDEREFLVNWHADGAWTAANFKIFVRHFRRGLAATTESLGRFNKTPFLPRLTGKGDIEIYRESDQLVVARVWVDAQQSVADRIHIAYLDADKWHVVRELCEINLALRPLQFHHLKP
ncbi:MAG: hypothetical protein AAB442_03165 [Patescibacteria group bacterium]